MIRQASGLMTKSDFINLAKEERRHDESIMPKTVLQQKHIAHLKTLTDREELLKLMPVNAVCAEIGVNEGEFSQKIFALCQPEKLHLIDSWAEVRYHDGLRKGVQSIFENEIKTGRVVLNHGYSTEVVPGFADNYFDWVYLDTGHDYTLTIRELDLLKNKIKPGGIIAGHDYIQGNWVGSIRYGVMEAVHEFCLKEDWEIIYLTINLPESPSFAIRRIS